jgi:hypothetical protein
MTATPLPQALRALVPGFASRFALILSALCALVAARFLRNPRLLALIVPVWSRISRAAQRLDRVLARLAEGRLPRPRPGRPGRRGGKNPSARLPRGHAWLVVAAGSEAACHASQLAHLLAAPGMAELLAAAPAVGRILRPLCRMLGIAPPAPPAPPPAPIAPPAPSARSARPVAPNPRGSDPSGPAASPPRARLVSKSA